jgi:hypothetical protein
VQFKGPVDAEELAHLQRDLLATRDHFGRAIPDAI